MRDGTNDVLHRIKYSFYSTLVYILVSNPITYHFTQTLFQGSLSIIQNGVPTTVGYCFHIVLFFLVMLGILMFPKDL
jgi:hypothetical protein